MKKFSSLWNNLTTSNIPDLNDNPFTQKSFRVRFINVLTMLFMLSTFLMLVIDLQRWTQHVPSARFPYFDFIILGFLFFVFLTLRVSKNIDLASSLFILALAFGGISYLLYFEKVPGNLFFVFIIPIFIIILKGAWKGLMWCIAFSIVIGFVLYAKESPILSEHNAIMQFADSYVVITIFAFFYQFINERYAKIAEANQEKILETLKKERELTASKKIFVTIAAHKLRTPVSILRWMVEDMGTNITVASDEQLKQNVVDMHLITLRLLKVINDILKVFEVDTGKIANALRKSNVENIVQKVCEELQPHAAEKKVMIRFDNLIKHEVKCKLDGAHMHDCIYNVVLNAIDYNSENGEAYITLDQDDSHLHIQVMDTGMGIPEDKQKLVFDKFYRDERAFLKDTEGVGVGLFITRAYVKSVGGKIAIKSPVKDGKGSVVTITLPVE